MGDTTPEKRFSARRAWAVTAHYPGGTLVHGRRVEHRKFVVHGGTAQEALQRVQASVPMPEDTSYSVVASHEGEEAKLIEDKAPARETRT